jgi:hypothetical protein
MLVLHVCLFADLLVHMARLTTPSCGTSLLLHLLVLPDYSGSDAHSQAPNTFSS